jgi:hypothetical protein
LSPAADLAVGLAGALFGIAVVGAIIFVSFVFAMH